MKDLPDDAVGKLLGIPAELVRNTRKDWNANQVMRAVLTHRLELQLKERRLALESISPEELKTKQGEIAALKLAITLITKTET